ncbi:uncharacterized protein P174DRAFT_439781 [Aspergillus novofumigatus IBT 16806]|uniref:Uncharacterized protein n=1 Tax=Aspergillus novofumigatus (strain IBT 16806) TaxID=1392255 RepID=A0A2I1CBY8_ASPN1|nr:uncharacterized protein P174DRAFT_439781 [Aspergillus novofumigatus IBT 16806]PKX95111.1 hypothetical protein P174DRAFT_439781 [Aspergillus novofumigatus IBT 16806]
MSRDGHVTTPVLKVVRRRHDPDRPATRPSGGEGRRLTTLTAPEGHKIFGGSP